MKYHVSCFSFTLYNNDRGHTIINNKKVQLLLTLTNPRDAKACQKLLQFDVFTTL